MALVAAPRATAKVSEVGRAIRSACIRVGLSMSEVADRMGLQPNNLSRQLNEQGPNLARLVNLPAEWWRAFLPELVAMVGVENHEGEPSLTERIAQQEIRITEQQERINELETLVRQFLERHTESSAKEQATA